MEEQWIDIRRYETLYQVSNFGQVKSLARITKNSSGKTQTVREKILKPTIEKATGYPRISLWKNGQRTKLYIHALVANAFIPNPQHKPQVNHKDSNRANNHVGNLEWVTNAENLSHAKQKGRMANPPIHRGENHHNTTLTENDIKRIRDMSSKGNKYPVIAELFKVSSVTIGRIVRRVVWRHI